MVNATMCFVRDGIKTLFLYRHSGKEDIHNGLYVPPGGKTERGERGIDCVIRELLQETGLKIHSPKLRMIVTFYNENRLLGEEENPDDWCVEVYEANEFSGELKAEKLTAKPVWVENTKTDSLPMHEGDRRIISLLGQPGIYGVLVQYEKKKLIKFDYVRVD